MSGPIADHPSRTMQARVNRICKMIQRLADCLRKRPYKSSAEQVDQMLATLQKELDIAKERLAAGGNSSGQQLSTSAAVVPADDKHLPQISIVMPDGNRLRATAYQNTGYPCINIEQISGEDDIVELVCFAEFNPEHGTNGLLYIGAYQNNQEDTTYYEPYIVEGWDEENDTY